MSKLARTFVITSVIIVVLLLVGFYFINDKKQSEKFQPVICETTYEQMKLISPFDENISLIGRFDRSHTEYISFAHSGSSISFSFRGNAFVLHIKNYSMDEKVYHSNYFNVFIDDHEPLVMHVVNDSFYYYFSDLGEGVHQVTLFKRTEAACGRCNFYGFYLDREAELYSIRKTPKLRMEFIGNSITAGYGVEDSDRRSRFSPATENHYLSYAAVSARLLNAEHHAICFSGKGVYRNYDLSKKDLLPHLYIYINMHKRKKWNFEQWQPDLIVLNAGTNDFGQGIPPADSFIRAYASFLTKIRRNNPRAGIIVVDGPLLKDGLKKDTINGEPEKTYTIYKQYLSEAIQISGVRKIYQFSLTPQGQFSYGANWHPGKEQQALNGKELANFIIEKKLTANKMQ